ncbi:TolC family protein [Zunongwangia sp. H14]|uniref:TolC family protein n=1 Tax=Zunongwangia sp. H14 TaxID=3240792 RepID=UPI00356412E2
MWGGQVRAVDILRQQQLLESTRNQKIQYETQAALFENELSVLLGTPPQNELAIPGDSLPELPPLPETGLPLELIRRRPDVLQAYNLVLAADREMAQAIRSKFPQLSLNLQGQMRSNNYNNLFQDWAYTLAGNIVAPLFYARRIRAEVSRTEALKQRQLYLYGQTVLTAFREVENALIQEVKQKKQLEVLQRRLELAQKTNRQLKLEFLNGITEYLDVLLALDQEQQLQRDILEARQSLLEIRISLYRALAGGFETETTAAP